MTKAQTDPTRFPHPVYAERVLKPGFEEGQRLLFGPMLAANEAHVIMLAETEIISREDAAALLGALAEISQLGPDAFRYEPSIEDLFFAVEGKIVENVGADIGGNLQIARSRNDLDAVMCRQMLRERLLGSLGRLNTLRQALVELAADHVETLMPGITHTQPAQPTTLAHYLLAVLGHTARDAERFREAYTRINRNPMGAAAFTTTGFPIDRELTSCLLGFAGIVENGYDAVGAADYMVETTGVLTTMASGLSRFVQDLLIWARAESGIIRIADAFVQISSIMPQKRNPVVLEHVRARIGYIYGDAATVATMVHSSAFGDTVDVEDVIYVPLARCVDSADSVLELMAAVIASVDVDRALLATRANGGFMTSTELADVLVREYGLPFRSAHGVVTGAVKAAIATGDGDAALTPALVEESAEHVLGRRLDIDGAVVTRALDPWRFVEARKGAGGPAPAAVQPALDQAQEQLGQDRAWLVAEQERLDAAWEDRQQRAAAMLAARA